MLSFFELNELIESSGMMRQDFTNLPKDQRMAQGKDIGEEFMRRQLLAHGIQIMPSSSRQDMDQKIAGFWNGEAVQLKLRRSGRSGSNDLAYEVIKYHDNQIPLIQQLQNSHQQGRDYKGIAKHYFVMNQSETEIYHVLTNDIKQLVNAAIQSLGNEPLRWSKNIQGVDLRPTEDKADKYQKVMAFVPVELVKQETYPVNPTLAMPTPEPSGPTKPQKLSDSMWKNILTAKEEGIKMFPKPNKGFKDLEKYITRQRGEAAGLQLSIDGNMVTLKAA